MKEESFINKTLKNEQLDARWLANQSTFNGSDNDTLDINTKNTVIFCLNVLNKNKLMNKITHIIENAHNSKNKGDFRKIIAEVEALGNQK